MGAATIEHPKTRSSVRQADNHGPAPIYVVCSPSRRVGKTLVARLLTDYCVASKRAVASFDLADESPQLNDFAPNHSKVVDIGDIRSQVRLFDSLVATKDVTKIIDVDRRQFGNFFIIAHKIQLFEEARRQGIEPVLLFLIDPNPKAAKAYATLRDWFPEVNLLPVAIKWWRGACRAGETSRISAGFRSAWKFRCSGPHFKRPSTRRDFRSLNLAMTSRKVFQGNTRTNCSSGSDASAFSSRRSNSASCSSRS
jgi:hypothetical protein